MTRPQADIEIFRAAIQIYAGHMAFNPSEAGRSLRAICIAEAREMFAMQVIPVEEMEE